MDKLVVYPYIDFKSIPVFVIEAEDLKMLKESYANHENPKILKTIIECLMKINSALMDKIVFGKNDSIIYQISIWSIEVDYSEIVVELLTKIGYTVEMIHAHNRGKGNKEYTLKISL
jgi:hypothetical protein